MIKDKVVVGAMAISRNPEMLKITIPNLLKHSDWVLLLLDNESEEVLDLALDFQKKNYYKIWLRRSSIPHDVIFRDGKPLNYHKRWKAVKGIVRDEIFINLRRSLALGQKGYDRIDMLLFPDQDEIFTDFLPELLERFWESEYRGIALKMVHVVNDMRTIKDDIMRHHVHIMKYSQDLSGFPWQFQNMFHPMTWDQIMKVQYYSVHLAYLQPEERNWRKQNWKNNNLVGCDLWKLNADVICLRPEEIANTFLRKPDERLS